MTLATTLRYSKGTMFLDSTGKPLGGGCLFYFMAQTLTPQSVYLDSGGTTVFSSGSVGGIPYIQLDYTAASSGIVGANTISPWPDRQPFLQRKQPRQF
jgi:hypothetical protein